MVVGEICAGSCVLVYKHNTVNVDTTNHLQLMICYGMVILTLIVNIFEVKRHVTSINKNRGDNKKKRPNNFVRGTPKI